MRKEKMMKNRQLHKRHMRHSKKVYCVTRIPKDKRECGRTA